MTKECEYRFNCLGYDPINIACRDSEYVVNIIEEGKVIVGDRFNLCFDKKPITREYKAEGLADRMREIWVDPRTDE